VNDIAASRGGERAFWLLIVLIELAVAVVAFKSPLLAAVFALGVGSLAALSPALGTRRAAIVIGALLVATMLILPGDIALKYRIPIGGGGVYIVDILLALLVASMIAYVVMGRSWSMVQSPVSLPMLLYLCWMCAEVVNGYVRGNDPKLILQDVRSMAYYSAFFFAIMMVTDRRLVLAFLRLLGVCVPIVFLTGCYYSAMGQGMTLEYVEPGVSRFPASDDVFLMSSVMTAAFIGVWPAGRRRPKWLWALLLISATGLILSFVRGDWVACGVALIYLLIMLRARERLRLIRVALVVGMLLMVGIAMARPAIVQSVISRTLALTAVEDRNVQWRLIENRAVHEQIKQSPIIGNGLGKEYLFDWSRYGVKPYYKTYIHNDYYWFVHRLGFVGLGLFIWLALAYLLPWMRYRASLPRDDPWLAGLVYGGRAMCVALLVVSVTSPRLSAKQASMVLALVMGLSEVALMLVKRRAGEESTEGGAAPQNRLSQDCVSVVGPRNCDS